MTTKAELRKNLIAMRDALDEKEREKANALILESMRLLAQDVSSIGIYLSFGSEIDTILPITSWFYENKKIYVPRVEGNDLVWILLNDFKSLRKSDFGVMEPIDGTVVDIKEIELMFVPLLGYDDDLHRIGYGKGFYDRALNDYKGRKIGLAYEISHVETIFPTSSDIPLDVIVTPHEIITKHR
jgi:5-formyltetrahydrofolate cyclo-ligase